MNMDERQSYWQAICAAEVSRLDIHPSIRPSCQFDSFSLARDLALGILTACAHHLINSSAVNVELNLRVLGVLINEQRLVHFSEFTVVNQLYKQLRQQQRSLLLGPPRATAALHDISALRIRARRIDIRRLVVLELGGAEHLEHSAVGA